MQCCKSGKAIIKFSAYKTESFRYRKNSLSPWVEIKATEKLKGECEPSPTPNDLATGSVRGIGDTGIGLIVAKLYEATITQPQQVNLYQWLVKMTGYSHPPGHPLREFIETGKSGGGIAEGQLEALLSYIDSDVKHKFTVKGEATGAEYLNLTNLDQCPEVQQEGCQLQPEQKFKLDVPFKTLPNLIYSSQFFNPFLTIPGCVSPELDAAAHRVNIWVRYKVNGISPDPFNLFGWDKVLTHIPYGPNCPPPQVTVTCDDDKSQECPPQTDCEIVCNGFKCCYSKGKLIKTIPV